MRSANRFIARACLSISAAALAFALSLVGVAETSALDADDREQLQIELGLASASASERGFRVGDLLQAIEDVELDEAMIASGSKVSVRAQKKVGGRVLLDLALADGHVVRAIPLTALRGSFRRVDG
jgi:hypothetical protein